MIAAVVQTKPPGGPFWQLVELFLTLPLSMAARWASVIDALVVAVMGPMIDASLSLQLSPASANYAVFPPNCPADFSPSGRPAPLSQFSVSESLDLSSNA